MARALSIAWRILVNLVATFVIVAMLSVAHSQFEKVVISALVLIYVTITGSFSLFAGALIQKGNQDLARFIELAKAAGLSTEIYQEALEEDRDDLERSKARFWINAVFRIFFFILAIGNLLYAVA